MFKVILLVIGAWLFFNLLFRFIIPVYRATREVKRKFNEFNANQQQTEPNSQPTQKKSPAPASDYIEFEEIK